MKKYFFLPILIFIVQYGFAQSLFNDHWAFQKLDTQQHKQKIENQGTNWEDQFSTAHKSIHQELKVPRSILDKESDFLENHLWQNIQLPHTPQIEEYTVLHQWQGICYYKKTFEYKDQWNQKEVWLNFGGAMQLADIWINNQHVTQHIGGYTPFVVNMTKYLRKGENEIVVRLDNQDNPLIPPGKPLNKLDFCYYGGLYRDVELVIKNKLHISNAVEANKIASGGVFVTYPQVTKDKATIQIKTHIQNHNNSEKSFSVKQELYKMSKGFGPRKIENKIVSISKESTINSRKDKEVIQSIEIEKPNLWMPNDPALYYLETSLWENGKKIDIETCRVGIRRIKFSKENGFEINGKAIQLVGTNRHMEYPYVGNALSDEAQYRDIYQIKNSGFNIVRLGHYPQDIQVLNACDELGLLAIEPTPGWQFFNKVPFFTEMTYKNIQDQIRRDRNHPCIVMWETILNESWPPKEWKDGAIRTAHLEYPGDQCYTSGDSYGYYGWDVQYNDWEEGFHRPNHSDKAGFIREYYDFEFGGHYSTTRIRRANGEQALLQNAWNAQWSHNRYSKQYPGTCGDAVWSMYDYNRGCCDIVCYSGLADQFRIPKFGLNFFESQVSQGTPTPSGIMPYKLFIANYWNNPNTKKVVIFGNVDEVALYINGKEVQRKQCDHGPDSNYSDNDDGYYKGGNPFDGGNCKHLNYAPFTFNSIQFQKGEIKAIGFFNGKKVTEKIVNTPLSPNHIEINYFKSGMSLCKNDLIFVNVSLKDKNNTLCVDSEQKIKITNVENGTIVGPQEMSTEAGIATFMIRTNNGKKLKLNVASMLEKQKIAFKLEDPKLFYEKHGIYNE